MPTDLDDLSTALRVQWDRLRGWIGQLDPDGDGVPYGDLPSVLDGWTVTVLVAHLGRAMEALAVVEPAPTGTVPLTLAEYLGTYHGRARDISEVTQALAREIADAPLAAVDERAALAFVRLESLSRGGDGGTVVLARRGPVTLRDMTMSRLIELVVHADDIARSVAPAVPGLPRDPVDRRALALVAGELLDIVVARGGWSLEVADARLWVRLAAGRVPYDVDELARALHPRFTSDGVPDLGRMLPIL